MRGLFFSDLHRNHHAITHISSQLKTAQIGIRVGDFAGYGKGLEDALEPLAIGTPLYLITGNHDDAEELKWICREYECFHYIHTKYMSLGGGVPSLSCGITEEGGSTDSKVLQ
jgi:DNA repair exonuclease SbcCD nuclease subunit